MKPHDIPVPPVELLKDFFEGALEEHNIASDLVATLLENTEDLLKMDPRVLPLILKFLAVNRRTGDAKRRIVDWLADQGITTEMIENLEEEDD